MKPIWHWCLSMLLCSCSPLFSQAAFTVMGTPYTQDFNTLTAGADGATYAWTNNTTLAGWYLDEAAGAADDLPIIEASYTTMQNGGSTYIYRNAGDCSLGSRAAGSTNTCYYGIRIVNNTGSAISSIYVDYYGEQWTIAENQTNVNTNTFDYQVGATVTSLTAGTWTNAPALNFTQIYTSAQSSGMGGSACGGSSAQCLALNGNLTANRIHIQGCITVAVPAGQEIMFRWVDIDNGANDHHLQIDDVSIYPFDIACAVILPVKLTSFTAERSGRNVILNWQTATEENNDYFAIERLSNSGTWEIIGNVQGNGSTSMQNDYSFVDEHPLAGTNYYRLRQYDYNGQSTTSEIRDVNFESESSFDAFVIVKSSGIVYSIFGSQIATNITMYGLDGKLIYSLRTEDSHGTLPMPESSGMYLLVFTSQDETVMRKIVVTLDR